MIIPTDDLPEPAAYKLLIGSIVPRAIAWVSTISPAGVANIARFPSSPRSAGGHR
jgi:hypothetical protein